MVDMTPESRARRRLRLSPRWFYLISLLIAAGVGVECWFVPRQLLIPFLLVGAIGSYAVALMGWLFSDEVRREAHKSAWMWGGGIGSLAGMIVVLLLMSASYNRFGQVCLATIDHGRVTTQDGWRQERDAVLVTTEYVPPNFPSRFEAPPAATEWTPGSPLDCETKMVERVALNGRRAPPNEPVLEFHASGYLGVVFGAGLVAGSIIVALFQTLGYGLTWAGWWISRR